MLKAAFEKSFLSFKKVLFPDKCAVCGELYDAAAEPLSISDIYQSIDKEIQRKLLGELICERCMDGFIPVEEPFCIECGGMFKSRVGENHTCQRCMENKYKGRVRSIGIYEGALLELIHRLKYNSKLYIADTIGKLLFLKMLEMTEAEGFDIVIPVPLYKGKMKKRGFNQSILFIREWDSYFDTAGLNTKIGLTMVSRIKNTKTQIGLTSKERKANLKNAFNADESVRDKRVLLVDDVYTTGATIESLRGELFKRKAKSVDVLTVARTGKYI